jgi:hypothetical protein
MKRFTLCGTSFVKLGDEAQIVAARTKLVNDYCHVFDRLGLMN